MTSGNALKLRDLLDLPPEVRKTDFVVRLTEGVDRPNQLLPDYAVTPALLDQYDRALTLVSSAIRDRKSTASYIHGSFGSGKSHFMAVLSLLLANEPTAWAQPAFHALRAKHEALKDKKVLRLHLHMVGARCIEEKIFPEFLGRARALFPDAPVPPLFEDARLFENAQTLRVQLGDAAFFAKLNEGQGSAEGWGDIGESTTWTAESFDDALRSIDPERRALLFSALVKTHFPAFEGTSQFVEFDRGLGILSRHAKKLGFDAVVFFLDEVILWLAAHASDPAWLNNEVQKLAKLVEAQDSDRPAPLVGLLARQRDISELVGSDLAGRDAHALNESMKWWKDRFDTIKIEDRNLPAVVERRVVRARDEAARKKLNEEFDRSRTGMPAASWQTLLGETGDEKAFRQVYPFSPVLIETVVALSNFLQRERTALRVLMELLVEHLEDFELGKVVPVGDIFDVLAGGEEPMDGFMRERFGAAKRLYQNELLPVIQQINGTATRAACQRLRDDARVSLGCSNCAQTQCRADNRLVKTLLLAALVPEVKSFTALTASRLVQLNHGTIRSPVQGLEASKAVGRLRQVASQVGKLRIGDGGDPTVGVVLEGVNLKPILESARTHDNSGNKRKKLQELLFTELKLDLSQPVVQHKVVWRGTERIGEVRYANVRELDETFFKVRDGEFKVILDFPFDEPGFGPQLDEKRVEELSEQRRLDEPTVVWLPSFFSDKVQRALGELVIVDFLLADNHLREHAPNLRQEDLLRARTELESLQSSKRATLIEALGGAYGFKRPKDEELDPSQRMEKHLFTLKTGFKPQGIVANSMDLALRDIVTDLLEHLHPRHPNFSEKVTGSRLQKLLPIFQRLCDAEGQRLPLEKAEVKELQPLQELGIITLAEASATIRPQRFQELDREFLAKNLPSPTVGDVRRALDPHGYVGFTPEVADFMVLAYQYWSRRELMRRDVPYRELPRLGALAEDAQLVMPPMPDQVSWQRALEMAATLFGISLGGRALNAANLRSLCDRLDEEREKALKERAHMVADLLDQRRSRFEGEPPRLVTARAVATLLADLATANPLEKVQVLASLQPMTSATAMMRHLKSAQATAATLEEGLAFHAFELLERDERPEAGRILKDVKEALEADALNSDLSSKLRALANRAMELQKPVGPPPPGPKGPVPPVSPGPTPTPGDEVYAQGDVSSAATLEQSLTELRQKLADAGEGATLTLHWKITRKKA